MKHILLTFVSLLAMSAAAFSENYCVATDGDDRYQGTSLAQPWATIQHAVDIMTPGDTCYIRGGVYREEVNLSGKAGAADKPITLTSYQGEKVTLDGTMRIDGEWVVDEGDVYKTTVNQDVTQLFVDGKLMTLARFPNALAFSDEVWHRTAARCQRSRETTNGPNSGHVVDAGEAAKAISNAGHSFNECVALMNFGAHATASRIVENHAPGSREFDYSPELRKFKTTLGYFFEGGIDNAERPMLDMAQEWALDESTKTLYLWTDNGEDPTERVIDGKVQTYAITGDSTTKHIVIDGLNFFATTFSFTKSDHITIRNCNFNFCACSKRALGVLGPSETAQFIGDADDFCSMITIYNCQFQYADASALRGTFVENMRIENNLFYQVDYACVNNDSGKGNPFEPSSTINLNQVRGLLYRRNTLAVNGNAQSFSANRFLGRPMRKFKPHDYDPKVIRPIFCEYNFHTRCGLLHTDGTSMYMPLEHVKESLARYNWFIDNGQRDFRYDGDNKPLMGVHANVYRNVCMSSIRRHSPSGGDGMHLKGDFHEVYNNLGVDAASDISVSVGSGGNANSVTRNNAAQELLPHPLPGTASHNYAGGRDKKRVREMLRDPANWDFRPRADAVDLIDQGTDVKCSVKGQLIDVTAGYLGDAPDIGVYEHGDDVYWIPGRQEERASMPVPKAGGTNVPMDADLMYLIGLGGVKAKVYLGTDRDNLVLVAEKTIPQNIVSVSDEHALERDRTYYWRVDTELRGGRVVKGEVWSFTTEADPEISPPTKTKSNE
ncbi:glycoside hydrolase family protein [Aporhodopirellula aestuarii]|uniref:DUF1565 domain-containing protein n=1 Tax=Aporhodopirellula aestuarii TaxID=2950107 RepID=A0ABT0UEA6_9BACT|nr:hypothetical protein [Aporhodopirellula aestuarii]MCM2375240.1 hypothetical protein [Aporhodopirellula aestuarii]